MTCMHNLRKINSLFLPKKDHRLVSSWVSLDYKWKNCFDNYSQNFLFSYEPMTTYFFYNFKEKKRSKHSIEVLSFGLSVDSLFSFYYYWGILRDARLFLEAIMRFQAIRWRTWKTKWKRIKSGIQIAKVYALLISSDCFTYLGHWKKCSWMYFLKCNQVKPCIKFIILTTPHTHVRDLSLLCTFLLSIYLSIFPEWKTKNW